MNPQGFLKKQFTPLSKNNFLQNKRDLQIYCEYIKVS